MKRHNMWGSNPIRKYVRLSSNSERGEDGGHSIPGVNYIHTMNNTKEVRKPALLPTPHDVLLKGHTDPTRADGGHTSSIRPEKPGLLPTPVTKTFQTKSGLFPSSRDTVGSLQSVSRPTSGPPQSVSRPTIGSPQSVSRPTSGSPQSVSRPTIGSPQSVSRPTIGSPQSVSRPTSGPLVVKSEETKIKPQNVNISKCDNGSELDVLLPTKTNPTTSPYFPNLDEFLMSNSEDELPIKDQPHNKETTDTLSEVGGNISGGNNVGETKKNAHVSCSFIDRKRYQSGPGYDDILRMANENVKKQRRLSQQDHVHKQDNSTTATNKVLQRSNSASPKKKKVHESPKKLLDTCTKRKEQLVIVPEVQVKLRQKGMLKICLNKLNIASETIKLSEEQETSEHDNTERRSLFQSFSNNEEIQSIVNERLEEIFMDTSETFCHDLPPPADNTEVPQDTIQNPADKKREEFGLFDRFRSSVTVSPSQTQNETSQDSPPKNNSPKKNLCKINLLNFKKLKEKVSTSASSIMQIKSELEPIPCDPGSVPDTHQPITKEKDDSLDIISSDDDDDDLPEPSLFLGNDTKRSKLENTTEREISFSQDSLSDSLYNNSINETEPEPDRFKLSLDSMVQNKQKNELKNAELQKMTEDLQGDLKTNLMDEADNLDDSTSNYILPDHKRKLDNFANPTNHMPDMYPGDEIFNLNQLGNIFSFPSTLRLADCGFIPVRGKATDDLLWKASPDNLVGVIDSCLLVEAHLVKPCQDSLMLWIFYFMSIHGKVHTIMQAFRTMWSLMNNSIRFNQSRVWLPTLKQITRVLLNYGASFEGLFPAPGLEPSFTLNEVVSESGKGKENMVEEGTENSTKDQSWTTKRSFPTVGLNHVMKIITHGMLLREKYKQPVFYTEDELMQLVGLVCRVALETKAKDDTLGEDFMLCSSSIIDAFSQQSWSSKCKELCWVLPGLTTHHHNLVHLVDLFPTFTDRGRSIRRLLSYYAILKLMSEDRPAGSVKIKNEYLTSEELRVFHLFPILNSIHLTEKTDYYQLYSLIVIVNTCIGNEKLPGNEKSDLYKLADKLHRINTKIKVSPNYPSMSKVKHILQRLQIKFKIMADSMVTKQDVYPAWLGNIDSDEEEDVGYEEYYNVESFEDEIVIINSEVEHQEDEIIIIDSKVEHQEDDLVSSKKELATETEQGRNISSIHNRSFSHSEDLTVNVEKNKVVVTQENNVEPSCRKELIITKEFSPQESYAEEESSQYSSVGNISINDSYQYSPVSNIGQYSSIGSYQSSESRASIASTWTSSCSVASCSSEYSDASCSSTTCTTSTNSIGGPSIEESLKYLRSSLHISSESSASISRSSSCSTSCSCSECSTDSGSCSRNAVESPPCDFIVSSAWSLGQPCINYYPEESYQNLCSSAPACLNKHKAWQKRGDTLVDVDKSKIKRMLNFHCIETSEESIKHSIMKDENNKLVIVSKEHVESVGSQLSTDGSEVVLSSLPLSGSVASNSASIDTIDHHSHSQSHQNSQNLDTISHHSHSQSHQNSQDLDTISHSHSQSHQNSQEVNFSSQESYTSDQDIFA